jgi:hypothetical protein
MTLFGTLFNENNIIDKSYTNASTPDDTTLGITDAIISVNTHGSMNLDENNKPILFKVPTDVKLIIVSAVSPGVCNYAYRKDIDKYNKIILDAIDITYFDNNPDKLVNTVLPELNKAVYGKYLDITGKMRHVKHSARDREMEKYYHTTTKNMRVSKHEGGDLVIDKTYERKNIAVTRDSHNYRIPILNVYGHPDIMETGSNYVTIDDEGATISLSYIVKYCVDLGIKNIAIFDFTCSVLTSDETNKEIENLRSIRKLRRDIYRSNLFGGRKNKTKRRQNQSNKKKQIKHTKHKNIKRSRKLKTRSKK